VDLDSALGGDLRAVVELASLAPSVHNTQPWRFTWDGRALSLYDDAARALPVLDPTGRERVLSCGCALQHARLALTDLGHAHRVDLLPDPADEHLLARVTVEGEVVPDELDRRLVSAVPRRVTDRDPFDERPVPAEAREAMRAAAEAEGAWLRFVGEDGQDDAVELQVLLSHADDSQRRDVAYLEELAAWRREQEAEGIPSRALPTVPPERRGSSWVPRDFDARSRTASEGPGAEPPVPEHPSVLVLGTRGDDRRDWLVAGQALARVLLQATADGLAAQPLTQVLEVPVLRGRMRHALGVIGHPQMLLRVGYGSAAPTSSRRPAEQILTLVDPR
jgi:hypothetical protein